MLKSQNYRDRKQINGVHGIRDENGGGCKTEVDVGIKKAIKGSMVI